MPDPVTHHCFGRQVLAELEEPVRSRIDPGVFDRALQGPDPWSTIGFFGGPGKRYACRSGIMHKEKTGAFFVSLARAAREEPESPVFSFLAGFLCHYCLDRLAHPYIICRGGWSDGTEATRAQRGGHVRLERAIDCWFIRKEYGKVPWHFSIPRQILSLKRYPESLRQPLDRVFFQVYGWEDTFDLLNASLRDERRFYALMQDPLGAAHYLLRPLSEGRTDYCMYSYYRRDSGELDCMNFRRAPWRHPYAPERVSDASFLDLFGQAKTEVREMLRAAYSFIYLGGKEELEACFGSSNYATGLDCLDSRNLENPNCDPMDFGGRYWNHA